MAALDWYEPHKKNVVIALKKGKGVSKDEAVPCALVKLKDGSHWLCAGVAKNKMIMDAKKAGGTVVSDGSLHGEDGAPTFEVSKGDVSVKVKFAAAAAEVLGSPLRVAVVKATKSDPSDEETEKPEKPEKPKIPPPPPRPQSKPAANESSESESESEEPEKPKAPPPPPKKEPADAGGFDRRLQALMPEAKEAMADPQVGKDIKLMVSEANMFARKGEFEEACRNLDRVEALLKPLRKPKAPPPPPPKKEPADAGGFDRRLQALMPEAKEAMADPQVGKDIKLMVSEANMFARKGEFEEACRNLDRVEALLKPLRKPKAPPPPPPKKEPADAGGFDRRLQALMPQAQKAMADPQVGKDIKLKISEANMFARKGDFEKACGNLDEVEALIPKAKVPPAPPPPPPPPKEPADAGGFDRRLKALMPDATEGMADPKVGKDIKLKISEANVFARKGEFEKACANLDDVQALLKSIQKPKAPPPPPPPKPSANDEKGFKARLAALTPQAEKLMEDPEAGKAVKLKLSEANLFARKKDFPQACRLLDDVEGLLKSAKKSTAPPPPPPPKPSANDEKAFKARLVALMPEAEKVMADPEAGKAVKLKLSEANLFARKKDFPQACRLLDDVEALLKTLRSGAPS